MAEQRGKVQRGARAPETRARILAAAIELIGRQGYAATSISSVCTEAGVVGPVLYWHFGSKEGLLGAVIDEVGHGWITELETRIRVESEPEDPLQRAAHRLNKALEGWQSLVEEQPETLRVLMVVALECAATSPEVREALRRFGRRALDAVIVGMRDATAGSGALGEADLTRLPDLDLLAHTVISLIQGAVMRQLIDPEGTDMDRLFAELRQTIALGFIHRVRSIGG